jgi:secernin
VCDTLCVLGDGVTLFAKNSDRPLSEPQVAAAFAPRRAGGRLRTQYIEIPDAGAFSTVLSRPTWLWGAEHGVNEHRVAIGNEMVFTTDDPRRAAPALIGMDLVRLGLERGRTASGALDAMTTLLDHHGQGGEGDLHGMRYWSSFLIADPTSAWVLETSGSTWAARPVEAGAAISNRLTLRRDWTRASADVAPGTDIDAWRHPGLPTGFADTRLTATTTFVRSASVSAAADRVCDPRAVVGALRDHGAGPWGVPGSPASVAASPAPEEAFPDGRGWTVCLHAPDIVTTASMVALLPADPRRPARAWLALGSPCVSVYVPVLLPGAAPGPRGGCLPAVVTDADVWHRFADLGAAVGSDAGALGAVRAELSAVEDALWEQSDGLGADPGAWETFAVRATRAVGDALDRLAAAGLGGTGRAAKSDR